MTTKNENPTIAQPSTSTSTPDLRPALGQALDQAERLVLGTDRADAERPTPCTEFDVAALVDHLLGVVRRVGVVVAGRRFDEAPMGGPASTDWAADWAERRRDTDAALAAADLGAEVEVPWGRVTIGQAIGSYITELATHAWDLASATGRTDQLDPSLAEAALPAARATIPAGMRGGPVPFGPVVETPDDAPAYDRLVAWCGRDPQWRA